MRTPKRNDIFHQTVNEEDHLERLISQAKKRIDSSKRNIVKIESGLAQYERRIREIRGIK